MYFVSRRVAEAQRKRKVSLQIANITVKLANLSYKNLTEVYFKNTLDKIVGLEEWVLVKKITKNIKINQEFTEDNYELNQNTEKSKI